MKIAYVGNVGDGDDPPTPPHSTENHVKQALRNLGHEVVPILERGLDWSIVPELAEGADVFLWTRTAGFDPSDLDLQRKALDALDIPTVGFHLDRWVGLNREGDTLRSPFFRVDFLFTADGGHDEYWQQHGINHYWSPPAILSDEAKRVGVVRPEYEVPVAFVGNLRRYGHPEWGPYRLKLYRFLAKTYGSRFRLWEGGIRGQDLADLYASVKVLVGDSCLAGSVERYWSDRVPETLGRGGFLIHPEVEGLAEQHPFLVTFPLGDFDELARNIDLFLGSDHPRQGLADLSRADVLERHTYEARMERVLVTVLG